MQQTRRRILQTGTGGIVAGLAGCSSFKRTLLGHQLAHQITIANVRYSPLRLDLTVRDDSGKILLEEHFRIAYDHAQTSKPFRGTPAKIQMDINGEEDQTYEWPRPQQGQCQGETESTTIVSFMPEKTYVQGNCETITTR